MAELPEVIEALNDLMSDNTVPRNIKTKLEETIKALKNESDISLSVNKALHELDEIQDDTNLQAHTRTQLWGISSMLETVC